MTVIADGTRKLADAAWMRGLSVPNHWRRQRVKHLIRSMRAGTAITADAIESAGKYPVYGANGLRGFTSRKTHSGSHVIIGRQGALCGNVHLVSGDFWASEHAIVATPASNIDARWLTSLLDVMDLGQYSTNAAQPGIGVGQIAPLGVYAPPVNEQRTIADFLDQETAQIDALVAKQEEFIALLWERRTGRTADVLAELGTPDTQLRRVARIQSGVTLSGDGHPSLPPWPYLRVANVQMGYVDLSEIKTVRLAEREASASMLRAGDVLMTEGGDIDKLGRGTVWDGSISPMLHQNHVFAVRPDRTRLLPEYLALWLDSPIAREYFYSTAKKTTNLASTNKTIVGRLPIRVPTLEQQESVLQHHSDEATSIDALIAKAQEHIAFAKERRSALITAAVTGQLAVRTAVKAGLGVTAPQDGYPTPAPAVAYELAP